MKITVQEETFVGKILNKIALEVDKEQMTIAELIQYKVAHSVATHNAAIEVESKAEGTQHEVEAVLNKNASQTYAFKRELADPEKETYRAWEAFKTNQLIVLIDNSQAESLEQEVLFSQDTVASFLKMTQLVGG
ncbi:hypothetical protein [Microscilla marina]|nr:hypothetical protein [Microscilla marina]